MWKEIIIKISSGCVFADPATTLQIEEIEKMFGVQLPEELKGLFLESNGVIGSTGLGVVWNTEGIKTMNLLMRHDDGLREAFMPFDHLLFFGDDGGGDHFGYGISATNIIISSNIIRWSHEGDDRESIAYSLEEYIKYALRYDAVDT